MDLMIHSKFRNRRFEYSRESFCSIGFFLESVGREKELEVCISNISFSHPEYPLVRLCQGKLCIVECTIRNEIAVSGQSKYNELSSHRLNRQSTSVIRGLSRKHSLVVWDILK